MKVSRVRARLTQLQLAMMAGVHPSRFSEIETAKKPVAEEVIRALDEELPVVGLEQHRCRFLNRSIESQMD